MIQSKIAILTCWYGPYPWYFSYFINSCSYNSKIDFFIITDTHTAIPNISKNLKIIYKTIQEIKATASYKFGFAVKIDYAYKLCDFKPAYEFIFPEINKSYGFWGHGDLDVVYSNIRHVIKEEILNYNDVIHIRHDYISGTFCLFRNNQQVNTIFMESKDYKKVYTTSEHFCFEKCNFLFSELQKGASILDYPDNIQRMTWVVKKAHAKGKLRVFFNFIVVKGTPGEIKWEKGRIIYKDFYEAMFYHLIRLKTACKRPKILNPIPDTFYFTPKNSCT